jgi:hypothetical protein
LSSGQIVYRVNWLRAKARAERAQEEEMTVLEEMGSTIRWYQFHKQKWQARAIHALQSPQQGMGHHLYAERQVAMWERLAEVAEKSFPKQN